MVARGIPRVSGGWAALLQLHDDRRLAGGEPLPPREPADVVRLSGVFSGSMNIWRFEIRTFSIGRSGWPVIVLVPRAREMTVSITTSRMDSPH
jgi:hypothetical protein